MSGLLFEPPAPPAEALLEFKLECHPKGKGRGRATRTGRRCGACGQQSGTLIVRTPDPTRVLETAIRVTVQGLMRRRGERMLDGALLGLVVGLWPRPQKPPHRKYAGRQWRPSSPDADNLAKLVFDALNGVAYRDDAIVCDMRAQTLYAAEGEAPGIEIYIWRAPMFPPQLTRSPLETE